MSIQWSLVIFTLLAGAGGCLFAFTAVNEFTKWSKKSGMIPGIVALALVVVGGFASVTHLSHPDRIMNALSHPASGIFTEALFVGIVSVCIIVYLICVARKADGGAKVFCVVGGVAGIVLAFITGSSYMMEAQLAWNSVLLPCGYLATALPIGAGLWWALSAPDAENGRDKAVMLSLICAVIGIIGILTYGLFAGSGTALFVAALICEAVALVFAIVARKPTFAYAAWVYVVAAVAAGLLFRILMWVASYTVYGFFS